MTFSLSLEVLYVAIMSIGRLMPVLDELLYIEQELDNPEDRYTVHVGLKVVHYRRTHCNY